MVAGSTQVPTLVLPFRLAMFGPAASYDLSMTVTSDAGATLANQVFVLSDSNPTSNPSIQFPASGVEFITVAFNLVAGNSTRFRSSRYTIRKLTPANILNQTGFSTWMSSRVTAPGVSWRSVQPNWLEILNGSQVLSWYDPSQTGTVSPSAATFPANISNANGLTFVARFSATADGADPVTGQACTSDFINLSAGSANQFAFYRQALSGGVGMCVYVKRADNINGITSTFSGGRCVHISLQLQRVYDIALVIDQWNRATFYLDGFLFASYNFLPSIVPVYRPAAQASTGCADTKMYAMHYWPRALSALEVASIASVRTVFGQFNLTAPSTVLYDGQSMVITVALSGIVQAGVNVSVLLALPNGTANAVVKLVSPSYFNFPLLSNATAFSVTIQGNLAGLSLAENRFNLSLQLSGPDASHFDLAAPLTLTVQQSKPLGGFVISGAPAYWYVGDSATLVATPQPALVGAQNFSMQIGLAVDSLTAGSVGHFLVQAPSVAGALRLTVAIWGPDAVLYSVANISPVTYTISDRSRCLAGSGLSCVCALGWSGYGCATAPSATPTAVLLAPSTASCGSLTLDGSASQLLGSSGAQFRFGVSSFVLGGLEMLDPIRAASGGYNFSSAGALMLPGNMSSIVGLAGSFASTGSQLLIPASQLPSGSVTRFLMQGRHRQQQLEPARVRQRDQGGKSDGAAVDAQPPAGVSPHRAPLRVRHIQRAAKPALRPFACRRFFQLQLHPGPLQRRR